MHEEGTHIILSGMKYERCEIMALRLYFKTINRVLNRIKSFNLLRQIFVVKQIFL